jgi:CMP-N,N'-diacetyllegionaminic acid synthase
MADLNILGLIPARGGSKSIPQKNVVPLAGKPLIAWTCEAARSATCLTRCVVSTDDETIAAAAELHGVAAPFRRPADLSGDQATSASAAIHAVEWLEAHKRWRPDILVLLQPTSPLRAAAHIDAALALMLARDAETVVSVTAVPHRYSPYSIMRERDGRLEYFCANPLPFDRFRRQDHPAVYARNGPAVLAVRVPVLLSRRGFYGNHTVGYIMDEESSIDIDDFRDLALAEAILARRAHGAPSGPLT